MLIDEIKKGIPDNLEIPGELDSLVEWVEENGYPISGCFELRADDGDTMFYWFGFRDVEKLLGQFGAGADGSLYCIWDNGTGEFPIVHMGSEGDSLFVLAPNFVEFLRLLAVGYSEIGFEDLNLPPEEDESNEIFSEWVSETFDVEIPSIGSEVTSKYSGPDFQKWVEESSRRYSK